MLTKIKNEFPQGSIWDERSKGAYGGEQCYEFARYLAARIFNGQYPTNGHKPKTPISNGEVRNGFKAFLLKDDGQYTGTNVVVEPGDVISVYGQQHHAIVWKVEGGKIYVAEAWGSVRNKINWGFFNGSNTESTIEQIKSRSDYTAVCVWKHPGGSNSAPVVTSQMSISGQTQPTGSLKIGSYFDIRGVISSTFPISQVTAGVYNGNGSATAQVKTVSPNTTSYNLVNIDSYIKFNLLSAGSYVYKVVATDTNGKSFTLVSSNFSVAAPAATYSISGNKYPSGNLTYGKGFGIYGTITSNLPLNTVTVGVYYTNGTATKQVRTISTSSTSCNIGTYFDPYIIFNNLIV